MRENDGRKLDHATLEAIRIRAVRQVENGAHAEDVAAALGMTRAAVYAWLAKYREGGVEALEGASGAGSAAEAVWESGASPLRVDRRQ